MNWKRKFLAVLSAAVLILTLFRSGLPVQAASPAITGIQVTEITSAGYRVTAQFVADAGVREVLMPTWTEANGQDELKWYRACVSGNQAVCYIPASEHNGETGTYITHVYLYDNQGMLDLKGTQAVLPPGGEPSIGAVTVTEVTGSGFRVTAQVSAPGGIAKVEMPTWTEAGGQDDLIWHQAAVNGTEATFYVTTASHKGETGKYITHIYLYDSQGRKALKGVETDVPSGGQPSAGPGVGDGSFSVGAVTVTEVSSAGYRVTAKLNSPNGIKEVVMPTWTEANGQDDLIWHQAEVSGDTASFYVSAKDHKGESGVYITHVYLRDPAGRETLAGTKATLPASGSDDGAPSGTPSIGQVSVTEVTAGGYRVTAKISAPAGVKEVVMPTWTEANGQDDLVWHRAEISGGTASCYIKASDHKGESGKYITHIYLRDSAGREVITGSGATLPASAPGGGETGQPTIGTISISEITSAGYRVTAQISAPGGIAKVEMPTWTEANGQDDLVWHTAEISGGTATCYIAASAHKGGTGKYITHVYLYDMAGNKALKGTEATLPSGGGDSGDDSDVYMKPGPGGLKMSFPFVTSKNTEGYGIKVLFAAPAGVQRVSAAVWTAAGGQDDLVWHDMAVSGNSASVWIPLSAHGSSRDTYLTNVWIWDYAGNSMMMAANVPIP